MRIFTGVKLDDGVRDKLLKELQPFKKAGPSIRWTANENIHLTLKYVGEVSEALLGRIEEALLAAKIPVLPFPLKFTGFGKFPAGEDLHIFWAGVEGNQALLALFTGIEETLSPLGIERDTRPFHPHLTLGRNRARTNFKAFFALLAEKCDLFLAEWQVAAFQLFASRLTAAGPFYTVLKEISLVQP